MRTTWTGSIAIGTTTTSGALNVNGTVTATTSRARIQTAVSGLTGIGTANLSGISGTPSSSTYLRGDGTWATASSGAGAANYIAMWTGTSSLSSSTIYQSGSSTGIGTTSSGYILDVENTDKTAYSGTGSGLTSSFVPKIPFGIRLTEDDVRDGNPPPEKDLVAEIRSNVFVQKV
jgi:hypothetical protein